MQTVVQSTIEKLLPPSDPAPKKASSRPASSSFDDAMKQVKPKPKAEETAAKPVAKKQAGPVKPRKQDAKSKAQATDEEKPAADEADADKTEAAADDAPEAKLPEPETDKG